MITDAEAANIEQNGEKVGQAPGIANLKRQRTTQVSLLNPQGQAKSLELRGSFRWIDAGLGNLLLGILNPWLFPTGLLVDWYTGALWDFKDEIFVGFRTNQIEKAGPLPMRSVAIAPPLHPNFILAQEGASQIEQATRARYRSADVHEYSETLPVFQTFAHNHKERNQDLKIPLLSRLQTTHRIYATLETTAPHPKATVRLLDLADRQVEAFDLELKVDPRHLTWKERLRAWSVDFVPNTFGLGQSLSTFAIGSFDVTGNFPFFIRGATRGIFGSGISLSATNVQQRYFRQAVFTYWRFRPTADLSIVALEALDQVGEVSRNITFFRGDGGFIPEVGLRFGSSELSLGIPLVLALHYAAIESGVSSSETELGFDLGILFSFSFFVSENWRLRMGSEAKILRTTFWDKVMRSNFPNATPVNTAIQSSAFVYVEYYFPQVNAWLYR